MSEKINFDYNKMTPFKWFIIENFPFLEDSIDGPTNYTLLCKLGDEINKNRDAINEIGLNAEALTEGYNSLVDYVDNYFNNLDVTEEINNKLDEMASDGTLTNLISRYIDPRIAEIRSDFDEFSETIEGDIETQNRALEEITQKVNSAVGINPIPVSSVNDMTDTSKIYVLTTSGKWYYYNGTEWTVGGDYQSSGITMDSVDFTMLSKSVKNSVLVNTSDIIDIVSYFEIGNVTITNEGWSYGTNPKRARVKEGLSIHLPVGSALVIPSGKKVFTGWLINNEYKIRQWSQGTIIIGEEGDYTFLFANVSETEEISNLALFMEGFKIIIPKDNAQNDIDNIKDSLNKKYMTSNRYLKGTISSSGISNSNTRVYNTEFIKFNNDCSMHITGNSNQMVSIRCFASKQYSSYISNGTTGWVALPFDMAVNKDWYYTIEAKYTDDSAISDLSDFSNHIKIYSNEFKKISYDKYNTPKLVYHRGMSSCRPENTIPSYEFCHNLNLKYVECDVHQTSDGVPVVLHDDDVSRTTNGTGNVNSLTYAEVENLYIMNSMYDSVYTQTLRVPSFEEFISFCREKDLYPFIELKETLTEPVIKKIVDLIYKYNMQKNCLCFSFQYNLVQLIESYSDEIKVAFMSQTYSSSIYNQYVGLKNDKGFILDKGVITADICKNVHDSGGFIGAYVVDTLDDLYSLIEKGVDFIITNKLLYNANINDEATNLYYEFNGTSFTHTVSSNERYLFDDVYNLIVDVLPLGQDTTINIGGLTYHIPSSNNWISLNLYYIPVPNDTDITISLSGSNCKFADCKIKRFRSRI